MKTSTCVFLLCVVSAQAQTNPITKVVQMISDLEGKITREGEASGKEYAKFAEWCDDRAKNVDFDIRTGKSQLADLNAAIENNVAKSSSASARMEELSAQIATDTADLKSATEIRAHESAEYVASSTELSETIDVLERAVGILQREMQKGGASMMQLKNAGSLAKALDVMVTAAMINSQDGEKLTALVQSAQSADDDDAGAPAGTVYTSHSGDIVSTLQDILDKAREQLDGARSTETSNRHNFEMLRQSLQDSIKFGEADLAAAKKGRAAADESKSAAEGDKSVTAQGLAEDEKTKSTVRQDCQSRARDNEAEVKSRAEELKALAMAKKVISESTGGAENIAYGLDQESFLQVSSSLASSTDLANFEAVRFVRDLAKKEQSPALSQLAMRMASAIRTGNAAGEDVFGKVKELIKGMIERLQEDGDREATHKSYCDKEMAETAEKKADNTAMIEKLSTKIDTMKSRSAQLKGQVADLQKTLAEMAASQAEMNQMRGTEKTLFTSNKAETEQGLEGIKSALRILRDYYAQDKSHDSADGAGNGIISLLEVVESDLSKGLAEMTVAESTSQNQYDSQTKDNEISKVTKDQDIKYKTKEFKGLDQAVAEASSDRANEQQQLDAVLEYSQKLLNMCTFHPDTYSERTSRRAAEIAGLKQALDILSNEASLLQTTAELHKIKRSF